MSNLNGDSRKLHLAMNCSDEYVPRNLSVSRSLVHGPVVQTVSVVGKLVRNAAKDPSTAIISPCTGSIQTRVRRLVTSAYLALPASGRRAASLIVYDFRR